MSDQLDPLADLQSAVEGEFQKLPVETVQGSAYDLAERLCTTICLSRTREQIRESADRIEKICRLADPFRALSPLVTAIRGRLLPVIRIPIPPLPETSTDTGHSVGRAANFRPASDECSGR